MDLRPLRADVALPLPVDQLYSYRIPDEFVEVARPGARVFVPFGRRQLVGYLVGVAPDEGQRRLKPLLDVLDEQPLIDEALIVFCRRLAEHYLCSLGEALKAALPPGINGTVRCHFELQPDPQLRQPLRLSERRQTILRLVGERVSVSKAWLMQELDAACNHDLNELVRAGFLLRQESLGSARSKESSIRLLRLTCAEGTPEFRAALAAKERRAPRQAALLNQLARAGGRVERQELIAGGFTPAVMRALVEAGHVIEEHEASLPEEEYDRDGSVREHELSPAQQQVVDTVGVGIPDRKGRGGSFSCSLLRGVTGSGKTQVYLELARRALEQGRSVLVLVPEIALTPQIVARFQGYLGRRVAVVHSRLTGPQRFDIWQGIRRGELRVVVGARSALFAPLERLGLVIVDEEHESSYKQYDPAPRYHARDAAVMRAQQLGIPVLLGSATPSLESWHNTRQGRYCLLELPDRISGRPMPPVELVNMREEQAEMSGKGDTARLLGGELIRALAETLDNREQAIVLQNRRGHSPWLQCKVCGEVKTCVRCDVSLVWHRVTNRCHCHLCGLELAADIPCAACGSNDLMRQGAGTQKVEEQLAEVLPSVRLLRMDRDTTQRRGAYVRMVREFNRGEHDLLLGTQSVAKGLDFPGVTLSAVIQADTELNLQDFRAREWTFQLISQLAGRAGRGERPGRVLVQSYQPDHEVFRHAARHDYCSFANEELDHRRVAGYPPFFRLCRLVCRSEREELAEAAVRRLYEHACGLPGVAALQPGPAPVRMVRREYRFHFLLRAERTSDPSGRKLRQAALACRDQFEQNLRQKGLSLVIDMDPQGVL